MLKQATVVVCGGSGITLGALAVVRLLKPSDGSLRGSQVVAR